jgi:hypothetical protein
LRKIIEHNIVTCLVIDEWSQHYSTIIVAFKNIPPESPILGLIVDAHCVMFDEAQDEELSKERQLRAQLPPKFLVNVMLRYSKIFKDRRHRKLIACDYHDHGSDIERKVCSA